MRVRRCQGWLPIFAWFVIAGCAPVSRGPARVTIVVHHGRFASVEEAARAEAQVDWFDASSRDDDACTESYAATELARFLPLALGLPPQAIVFADSIPSIGDVIVVGNRTANPIVASLGRGPAPAPQGFRLDQENGRSRRVLVVEGGDRAGTLYGSYALLEEMGLRFYGLGDTGTVAPVAPSAWPRRLAISQAPSFAIRGFWAWEPRGNREFFEWMARNRMNLWTSADTAFVPLMKKLGIRLTGGGHGLQAQMLSPATYFASHPDWFGLHGGRRSPALTSESGDNFCTGNAAARHRFAANVVEALARGSLRQADVLETWMLDAGRWCECDLCRAQGSPSDRVLAVAADVAAAVDSAYRAGVLARTVEVRTLAYLETRPAPTHDPGPSSVTVVFYPYFRCDAHALADTTCTEINAFRAADYRGWRAIAPSTSWGVCEYYDVAAFKTLPLVFPHVMATDLSWYRRTGATELTYMHVPTRAWGTWTLHQALLARLAWDSGAKPDPFIARFCQDFYPGAGRAAVDFYHELEIASANILALQASAGVYGSATAGGRLAQSGTPVFPLAHFREATFHPAKDDGPDLEEIEAAMTRARIDLNEALRSARGPLSHARLEEVNRRFAYGEAVFTLYSGLIRTAVADRARDGDSARREFARARAAAERLRGVHDLVQVSASHANAVDGFEASGVRAGYEYFERLYGR